MALSSGTPASSAKFSLGAQGGGSASQGVSGKTRSNGSLTSGSSAKRKVTPPRTDLGHGR